MAEFGKTGDQPWRSNPQRWQGGSLIRDDLGKLQTKKPSFSPNNNSLDDKKRASIDMPSKSDMNRRDSIFKQGFGHSSRDKAIMIAVGAVLILIMGIYVIRPSIQGYAVYQDLQQTNLSLQNYAKQVDDLQGELVVASTNLTTCDVFNAKLFEELRQSKELEGQCQSTVGSLQKDLEDTKTTHADEIKVLNDKLSFKDSMMADLSLNESAKYNSLKSKYDLLAQNTAKNICCKMRVDNPRISAYAIESDRIICLESGSLSLSC